MIALDRDGEGATRTAEQARGQAVTCDLSDLDAVDALPFSYQRKWPALRGPSHADVPERSCAPRLGLGRLGPVVGWTS